jgi:hypothetical protein
MRLLITAIVTLSVGAGAGFAQTGTGSSPSGAAPAALPTRPASLANADLFPPLRLLPTPAFSTTSPPGAAPTEISPQRRSPGGPQSGQGVHDAAVADCVQMWDAGTHMTRQAWSHTCKRVQTRLDNLNLDAIMPNTETTSRKPRSGKKQVR